MIALLAAWIKDIVLILVFAVFSELLLPSSRLQRFVRLVLGLCVLSGLLHPILAWQKGDMAILIKRWQMQQSLDKPAWQQQAAMGSGTRERWYKQLYQEELARQMQGQIQSLVGNKGLKVEVVTGPPEEARAVAGPIQMVHIWLEPMTPQEGVERAALEQKLLQYLTTFYQLAPQKIQIHKG